MRDLLVSIPIPPTPPITAPMGRNGAHLPSGPWTGEGVGVGVGVDVGMAVGAVVGIGVGDGKTMGMIVVKRFHGGLGFLSDHTNSRKVAFLYTAKCLTRFCRLFCAGTVSPRMNSFDV